LIQLVHLNFNDSISASGADAAATAVAAAGADADADTASSIYHLAESISLHVPVHYSVANSEWQISRMDRTVAVPAVAAIVAAELVFNSVSQL
jgi:hypothetical protein